MADHGEFPLVTGRLSLDLVNTEVVRRGTRHNLLATVEDLRRWIDALEQAGGLTRESLPQGCDAGEVLPALLGLRDRLREGFERIVNGEEPEASWKAELEERVERAPLAYKLCGRNLIPVPMGPSADAITSLVALDALNLLATGELQTLRRCANPDCVLLFMDSSGRRP